MTVPTESIPGANEWNARLRAQAHTLVDAGMPVADALHLLGVGGLATRPLPEVALGPSRPASDVVVTAGDGAALLQGEPPPGATSHRLWVAAPGVGWRAAGTTEGPSWWVDDLENGTAYSLSLIHI